METIALGTWLTLDQAALAGTAIANAEGDIFS